MNILSVSKLRKVAGGAAPDIFIDAFDSHIFVASGVTVTLPVKEVGPGVKLDDHTAANVIVVIRRVGKIS